MFEYNQESKNAIRICSYHFYLMFQIFNIPRVNYNYYRPTIYRRRYVPIESYLLNSIRQAQEIETLRSVLYNSLIRQYYKDIPTETKTPRTEPETKDHEEDQIKETSDENKQNHSTPSPIYYFESHSRFDGEKLIEERKERKIDSEGKVHQTLKRRLGERWYETEQIEDKEGQIENKETWHNVSEEEIEQFKNEWISKSGQNHELTSNSDDEKEKEETKDNQFEKDNCEKDENDEEKTYEQESIQNETNSEHHVEKEEENQENESTSSQENEILTEDASTQE